MSRFLRTFMTIYAAATIAVSAAPYLWHRYGSNSVDDGFLTAASISYVVLALGCLAGKNIERAPARPWLIGIYVITLATPVVTSFFADGPSRKELGASLGYVSVFLAVTPLLLADVRSERVPDHDRLRRWLVPGAILAGAALMCASLAYDTTYNDTGWNIVTRKAPWITSGVNVATPILFGDGIKWLQPIYTPGGYFFYLVALVSTFVLLIWMLASRVSIERLESSRVVRRVGGAIVFTCLWIQTDIYWAWHLELHNFPWAAVVATILWLAGPLFGALLLVRFSRDSTHNWCLRAFVIFQLPVGALNFLMLFAYAPPGDLHMEGLGLLIVGLQVEAWACMDLLRHAQTTNSVTDENPVQVGTESF